MSRTKHILSYSIPIVILLFFLFGSFFAPHDPTATNIRGKYLSSSAEYPFGTDDFGRCEFSRILEGGKITLGIVLVGSAIVILLGIFFGILLAKTGRRRNILAESILNAVTAIPPVAYLIIFIGIWGNSIPTMLVALTASLVLRMIKLVIIIFDEATAYLDPENESLIQEAISKLVQGKTLIMVAHRLYTVTGADQLVVVNQGRIEATGTHEELLKKCPLYKEMWKAHIGSRDEGGATA